MTTTLANISIKDSSSWNTYLNLIYPVGSIYIAYTSTSPASRFGGTWSQITSRFLYCTTNTNTGGEQNHTLNTSEMPAHDHTVKFTVSQREASGYGLSTGGGFLDRPIVTTQSEDLTGELIVKSGGASTQQHATLSRRLLLEENSLRKLVLPNG